MQELKKATSGITRLSIKNADISEEETDIIVNTTTAEMKLSSSAVSKAILKKAGPILQQTCDQLIQSGLSLDHGQIVETKAFGSLQCKRIIHAHIPPRSEAVKVGVNHSSLIAGIISKCLSKAESMGMKSVSFPAFGFGQGYYSVREVAEPMLTAFRDFGSEGPKQIQVIRVVILDQKLHKQFFDFYVNFFKLDVSVPRKYVHAIRSKLNPKGGHEEIDVELQCSGEIASMQFMHQCSEPVKSGVLLFDIYANSEENCTRIAARLKEIVKEKCVMEEIENPFIAYLIDADISDIHSIGTHLQVQVDVILQVKKIEIQGEKDLAKEAKMKISGVLSEIEESASELKFFQWQRGDDDETYSYEDSFKLERARAKKIHAIQMAIDDIEVIIDLDKMEERSATGIVRKVNRSAIKQSGELHSFIVIVSSASIAMHVELFVFY